MAGLIDTSLIRPELAGSFAAGYRGAEQARQQSAQAEQQLARGRQQMQMDEMKMRQLQDDRAALTDLQARLRAAGQSDDPTVFFRALTQTSNPDLMAKGFEGLQRYQALMAYEREFGPGATAPASAPSAITKPAAPEGELVAAPIRPIPSPITAPAAANAPAPAGETDLAYLQRQFGTPAGANALAPTAAAPANAMIAAQPAAPAQDVNALARQYRLAAKAGSPDAPIILKQIEAALKGSTLSDRYVPVGNLVFDRVDKVYISPTEAQRQQQQSQDPVIRQYEYAKGQGFTGSLFDFKRQLTEAGRAPTQPRPEPAPRTQRVELSDGSLGIMNMDTGAVTRATVGGAPAKGKPSAFAEKTQAQRAQLEKDLTTAITELKDAAKPGGLIDQSTGSGIGRGIDIGARLVGKAMPGDIAIGKLAPIADLVLKMVPRFEGPQSDKDTKSYKEAAGQLSDAGLPREIRKQAANTIVRLMENRKGQFVTKEMAAEGAAPTAAAPALPPGFTRD